MKVEARKSSRKAKAFDSLICKWADWLLVTVIVLLVIEEEEEEEQLEEELV